MSVSSDFEGELVVRTLEAAGIEAHVFSATARTLSWMIAPSRPIRVQVRRRDLERAREALEARRQELEQMDLESLEGLESEGASEISGRGSSFMSRVAILVLVLMILLIVATVVRGLFKSL